MKFRRFLLVFVFLFCFLLACDNTKQAVKIEIDQDTISEPISLSDFALSDIILIVTYDDGTQQRVELKEEMISQADLAKLGGPGEHVLTVTAFDKTIEVKLTITTEMWQIFRLAQEAGSVTITYEEWLASIKGADGKSPVFRIESGWLQWQYPGDNTWTDLLELSTLRGSSGKELALQVSSGEIQWQYVGDTSWQRLISLETLTGANGREVNMRVEDGYIQWQHQGESVWQNLVELSSLAGRDGREIVLNFDGGWVKWKYVDDTAWTNLLDINSLLSGMPVKEVDFRVSEGWLQWQYKGDQDWTNILDLSDITFGKDGLSAYELYKSHHPEYTKSEEEWLDDLVNGRLSDIGVYTVTFDPKGGDLPENASETLAVPSGSTILLPLPTKEGYIFKGWVTGFTPVDGRFTIVTPVERNLMLYADWEPEPEKAKITYYTIDEIDVKDIKGDFIVGEDNRLYLPVDQAIRNDTKEKVQVYVEMHDYFSFDLDIDIADILYCDFSRAVIMKTTDGHYFGGFGSNEYGQYGLGHTDSMYGEISELFTGIEFEEGESIEIVYVFETYNIAITSSNRVFLTGTIMFGEPLQALTALEITDEFDLEEGEVFLPQDTNVYLEYIQNEVIFTNLHRFGLSAFFGPADESLVPDKLYLNLSLILGEDDEALFVYYSTRGSFAYIVTINGSIIIWSHDNQITAQMELQPDEILLSHVMGLYFTTNKGRVLFANAAEENEIIIHDISEDFNIGTNIVQCYVNLNYNEGMNYAILVGENEDIYRVTYDQTTMQFVFENLTAKLKGFGTGEIITVAGTEGLYTYYVADGAFFALYNINIEPLFIPVLKPVVKEYILNEEVTLEDYHHDKYAIIGWTDFDSDREYDETLTLDKDITLIPNFAGYVSIYIDSGYYSYQMNVLEGEVLTRQEIIDKADVPYGMVIADIVDQYGDSFTEQVIWEEDFLNLVLDYADGHFVGLVIVNSDKDILEYKDIFVMDGDSLANPNIEFNIPENINVIGYYQDADLLTPYILDQEVSEDLIIYLCIEEAQKFKVTLNLPGSDKIIYEVLEKSGVDIYELRRLIHIENYALDGIFYDPEFTQVFDYEQVKADLDLYVKLLWERYVRIEFYLYGNLMKVLYEKLTEGGSPADIKMNDLFVLDGVYLDSDFTQQVFTFTDSNVSTLYAQVSQVPGYNLQIIFPEYQELNYQLNNFRGGYFNLRDLINNNLSNHSTSYQIGFDLYFDAEMQNQVEYDIEFYDNMTLYVDIRDELVSIMFVGEDVTIHAYHCAGQDFDISNIYRLLAYYDESKNWQIYGTYNDPTYLNEYQYGTPIYSPITLYIQLSSNDFAEISVTIVGWNINFNIYQEEMGLYQYLIFNRLQEIGFAPSEFDYAIYTDEECTTPYDYHTVSDGEHLYIQVTPRNQVRLIIEFPELDIPPLVIYLNQGDQYYSYLVSEYLQDYYFGYSISVYVYLDDTFQTPFSGLVDQNLTVYADADIRPMIYVRIFAPFTGLDGQTFGLEAGQSISIQTIEETGQFVNVNGIYLDPECTVPYTATPIMETTCLFIKISN